jgi:hypothetical protein
VLCAADGEVTVDQEHGSELYKRMEGCERYCTAFITSNRGILGHGDDSTCLSGTSRDPVFNTVCHECGPRCCSYMAFAWQSSCKQWKRAKKELGAAFRCEIALYK